MSTPETASELKTGTLTIRRAEIVDADQTTNTRKRRQVIILVSRSFYSDIIMII